MSVQGSQHAEPLPEQPPEYVVAHVQEALATDTRVAELGIGVSVAGGRLFLTGTVSSDEQRDRAGDLAVEVAGDLEVCNDLEVAQLGGPGVPERLA